MSSKTAIERACKGLGISDDEAGFLKSLIPVNRGNVASLPDCLYGKDKVNGLKAEFDKHPNLERCAVAMCDLICQRGLHAAGLCITNEPYVTYLGAMKSPNGIMCTAFNLWDAEAVSLVKMDLLNIEALQKMHKAMDAMLADGAIEWQGDIRSTYNKYFHPDVIDYDTKEMWHSITKMYSCFQWETPVGVKAINQIQPDTIMDLSAGNSLIRLMPEGRSETPLDTYVRYKEHPEDWEAEATAYGLNEEEKAIIRHYCGDAHYLADCQEKIMRLSQDPHIAGYTLRESNLLRKAIAKKNPELQAKAREQFFECGSKLGTREIFLKYVWEVLFSASFGYAFSSIHSYSYSIIALQELNMYYHYNPVYWNVGCLSSEALPDEESGSSSTDYGKMVKALYKMRNYGVAIQPPNINKSNLDFTPDAEHKTILYGLAGISGINADIANQIISNRPYTSFKDFYTKNSFKGTLVTPSKFKQLIKSGCFDDFESRRANLMKWYISYTTPKPTALTGANIPAVVKNKVAVPKELLTPYKFYKYATDKSRLYGNHPNFKSKKIYWLDERGKKHFMATYASQLKEGADYWEDNDSGRMLVVDKSLEKVIKPSVTALIECINTPDFLDGYHKVLMKQKYLEFIDNNEDENHWSFESVSFYSQAHELAEVNFNRYNISHFSDLPVEPRFIERSARGRTWREYELSQIMGTVVDKSDNHHFFTILTPDNEVVNCNIDLQSFAYYKKQISETIGEKTEVVEKSWLERGTLLIVAGYRRNESDFACKRYSNSVFQHRLQKITKVHQDGSLDIQTERYE